MGIKDKIIRMLDPEYIPSVKKYGENQNPIFGSEVTTYDSPYYDASNEKPYNPDLIYKKTGNYKLFNEMREDDQISAVLKMKKIMLLCGGYYIESENDDIKDFLYWNLEKGLDKVFMKKMYEVLSAIDFGFNISEKIWEVIETPFGQKIVLKKLHVRAPDSFEFHQDKFGNLEYILQHGDSGEIKIDKEMLNKFVIYSYQSEFDNFYGKSDMNLGVYRAWYAKDKIIKFWNMYIERFGMPIAKATYPKSLGDAVKSKLLLIMKNLQARTGIALTDDISLELLEKNGQGADVFEKAIDKMNLMIARSMLVPDLLGISGEKTGGGSYSLGQDQFESFYSVLKFIQTDLEDLINREIISPLVKWNFGDKEEAELKFNSISKKEKVELGKLWIEAVKTGKFDVSLKQINWFNAIVDAPETDQEDFDKKNEMNKKISDNMKSKEEVINDENGVPPKEISKESSSDKQKSEYSEGFFRPLTIFEKRCNLQQVSNDLDKINLIYKENIYSALKLMINGLVAQIKDRKIVEKKRLDLINKLTIRNVGVLKKSIKEMTLDSYYLGTETASAEKEKKYEYKNYLLANESGLSSEEIASWLDSNSEFISSGEAAEILKKTKPVLQEAIRQGLGIVDTIKLLDEALKDYGLDSNRLETIVRTNINRAFNEGRAQEFAKISDEIVAYQYSAIMDGRTSEICASLDGKVFKPSELVYYNPPNHFNCRSVIIPIFKGDEYSISDDIPGTERAAGGFLKLTE